MDFTEPTPVDPTTDPAEARRLRASWILLGVGALVLVLVGYGMWNPGDLVVVDRWLNHPCEFIAALVPLGLYVFHLRSDGDTAGWIARRIALVSLIPLALVAISLVAFAPEETVEAVSPSGEYEVVAVDVSLHRAFVLRTRDGLLSRQAATPLYCITGFLPPNVRFADEHTIEFEDVDDRTVSFTATVSGLTVLTEGCS
ncbi:hypothetical protein [Longispora urticae]